MPKLDFSNLFSKKTDSYSIKIRIFRNEKASGFYQNENNQWFADDGHETADEIIGGISDEIKFESSEIRTIGIGRGVDKNRNGEKNRLILPPEGSISRFHCEIFFEEFNGYVLNDKSLERLKLKSPDEKLPQKLHQIRDKSFLNEKQFVSSLENILSGEEVKEFGALIMEHALHGPWKIRDVREQQSKEKSGIGIFVNNEEINEAKGWFLRNGDTVRIADIELRIAISKSESFEAAQDVLSVFKPKFRRVKSPTVIQMEAVECGAASLGIVLGYFGKFVPLEELRESCGVSRDGSKAINILKAARKYGLLAKGFKYDVQKLFELKYPVILHWNFNHFLVLEGFRGNKVFLNDPARGPRTVTLEELDISFSGVVLTFEPRTDPSDKAEEPLFEKAGKRSGMLNALRERLSGAKSAMIFVVLSGLLLVIPGLIIPTFSRIFIDEYLVAQKTSLIKPLLIGMFFTAILRMILTWLQEYFLLRYETKLALISASRFFEHILRLPVSYFTQRYAGEIGSRVMLNNNVAQLISGKLATTMVDTVQIVFYAVLMFMYDTVLTGVCIVLALCNIAIVRYASRKRVDASQKLLQEQGKLMGTAMNGLRMIETLKATGSEGEFFQRWAGYQAKALKSEQELAFINTVVSAVPPVIKTLITTIILALGGMRVMDGYLTVGMLVAFQTLMSSFTQPLANLVNFGGKLQELEGDMKRLDDVLHYPQDAQYKMTDSRSESFQNMTKLNGHVELRNITFGYSPLDKPLIENFSLTIKPGQRVALVGGSGSGKSTVARLITGLYKTWNGEILFDGVARERIPSNLLYNSLGIIDQDIFLFAGSIRENLSMWDATVPDANIISGARDAVIDTVIQERQSSYYSEVEEGGKNFSGGQCQRLEIARSLVVNPSILILDEATSALDPSTEKQIDEHLRRRGCSCIIVAHRLSTIRDCDEIIVLDKGKISERGTHEQLLEKKGLYARLIEE